MKRSRERMCGSTSYLVPEKKIGLTKLKLLDVMFRHEGKAHDVETWEDPTSPYEWREGRDRNKWLSSMQVYIQVYQQFYLRG